MRSTIICLILVAWLSATIRAADVPTPRLSILPVVHAGIDADQPSWMPLKMPWSREVSMTTVRKLLSSKDSTERARSAFVLGQAGGMDDRARLARRLHDPEKLVRTQAGIALACLGDARGVRTCTAVLEDGQQWLRYYAAYGLWRISNPKAKATLKKYTGDPDPLIRRVAVCAVPTPKSWDLRKPGYADTGKPSVADVWIDVANVMSAESDYWWHRGEFDQCIRAMQVSIFMDPKYVDDYSTIAWLQWSMGRIADAESTLKRGTEAAPRDPDAWHQLGYFYFLIHRYEKAEGPLKTAVDLGGDNLVRRTYAHCLEKLGKLPEALDQWASILKSDPGDAAAKLNYDRVKGLLGPGR